MLARVATGGLLVILTLAVACTPDSELVGTLSSSSGSTGAGSSVTGSSGEESSDATSTSRIDTGSTGSDACAAADPAACPDDCVTARAWRVDDQDCTANPVDVCVAQGEAADSVPTTYWIDGPDGPLFVEVGLRCGIDAQPAEDWRECGGGDSDPIDCACFCAQAVCAGDAERLALEACAFAEPCPSVAVDYLSGTTDVRAEQCVLEALADRAPGLYEWSGFSGFGGTRIRFHVDDSGVQIVSGGSGEFPECPTTSEWSDASRCELAPSEYFTGCLDLLGSEQDCALTPEQWTIGCVMQPPSCPR